ncbi:MAG: FAD-dependent oxidoreductase [Candidatus Omnitrophota bacterium]
MARIVIIGASCAGHAVATGLREMRQDCSVTLVTQEKYPAYDRRRLLEFAGGSLKEKDLFLCASDFYRQKNIDFLKECKVSSVNTNKKTVHFKNRDNLEYDFLVICSGRSFILPEIPGIKKNGVFRLSSLSDGKDFQQYGSDAVCIVGASAAALRFAQILSEKQKNEVKLISAQLVAEAPVAEPALAAAAQSLEPPVVPGAKAYPQAWSHLERIQSGVVEIIGESAVQAVKLSAGKIIGASAVVYMDALKSNIDFLKNADISINDDLIEVDEGMRTRLSSVFACGAVCARRNASRGEKLWEEALVESRAVVENLIKELGS